MIERVTCAVDVINVLNVFCSCYMLLFRLLAKPSSAVYYVLSSTPHHTQIIFNFAIIKLFLLFNTGAKTNQIDNTRPTPLSMNELTSEYWN